MWHFTKNYIKCVASVAITGLDDYSSAPQHALTQQIDVTSTQKIPGQDCNPLDWTLLPKEIAHASGYDQLWNHGWHGENMTVNLVEIDGYCQDDMQNYFDCINFQGSLKVVKGECDLFHRYSIPLC